MKVLVLGVLTIGAAFGDVVSDWNAIMVTTVGGQNPFAQARFAAITQLAVFEAVNGITGDYTPYLSPVPAPSGASVEAAVVTAAHTVLLNYFPSAESSLNAARTVSLEAIADGPSKTAGMAAGAAAAVAMIEARSNDGSGTPAFFVPQSSSPGEWQLTASCPPAGGILRHWPEVTPFGIKSAAQFRLDPPPDLTSNGYRRAYDEVMTSGSLTSTDRPQDRADVARFYAAASPVVVFNSVARQINTIQGNSLSEYVRALALLNIAISDAAIAVFDTKYHYRFWRPETAIRAGDTDDNPKTEPDTAFAPFIGAPCFPGYPSAHATLSNAAREVIESIYGGGPHPITLSIPAVPGVTLEYSKLKAITADIDDARVYGGIHFRYDQEAGAEQGRRVAAYVIKKNLVRAKACTCTDNH